MYKWNLRGLLLLHMPFVSKYFQPTYVAEYGLNLPHTLRSQTVHLMGEQQDEG